MPENVTGMLDRHGKYRLRFRKTGYKTHYFKSSYPSRDFWDEYDVCVDGKSASEPIGAERIIPGTVHDLVSRYISVPARLGPTPETRARTRAILENDFRYFVTPTGGIVGNKLVSECDFEPLEKIIAAKASEAPWQARKLRRHLRKLFDFAKRAKMIDHNPILDTEPVAPGKSKGYHCWTEGEIDQFAERHPLGTMPYLAMMLMLWTWQRRGDASRMAPEHIVDGRMEVYQSKGDKTLWIPVADVLKEAIAAVPRPASATDATPFILNAYGRPFTSNGLGNKMRQWCDEAGLPQCSAHGLRKAAMRRAAEEGASNQSMKSVSGHVRDDEVAHYTAAVEQRRLADKTMKNMERRLANRKKRLDK